MHSIQRIICWYEVMGESETISNSVVKKGQFYCEICKYCFLVPHKIFFYQYNAQHQLKFNACLLSTKKSYINPLNKQTYPNETSIICFSPYDIFIIINIMPIKTLILYFDLFSIKLLYFHRLLVGWVRSSLVVARLPLNSSTCNEHQYSKLQTNRVCFA